MEPKRLTEIVDTPSEVAQLLRSARRDQAPAALRKSTWRFIVAKSAAAGLALGAGTVTSKGSALTASSVATSSVTAGAASSAGSIGTPALLSKGVLVFALKAAVVGTSVGMGAAVLQQSVAQHQARTVVVPNREVMMNSKRGVPEAEARVEPAPARLDSVAPATGESTVTSSAPRGLGSQDMVRPASVASASRKPDHGESAQYEAQRVAEVRSLLRKGDGQSALAALSVLDRQHATRLLEQERAALRIDALLHLGRRAEAVQEIQRFRVRYPRSPLSERWSTVTTMPSDRGTPR